MKNKENIFEISIDPVQSEAKEYIGRKLTNDELNSVKRGIEAGLLFDIDTVFKTAINDAVEQKF